MRLSWMLCGLLAACRLGFDPEAEDAPTLDQAALLATFGGTLDGSGQGIAFLRNGGYAVAGTFAGSIDLPLGRVTAPGLTDLFVAVFDEQLRPRGHYVTGATDLASATTLAENDDAIFVGGYFLGDIATPTALASGAGQDALVVEVSPASGCAVAATAFGGSSNVQMRGVAGRGAQRAYAAIYSDTFDFGLGPLPITSVDNGAVVSFGTGSAWQRVYASSGDAWPNSIAYGDDGSVCVAGRINGTSDLGLGGVVSNGPDGFVAHYAQDGTPRWARLLPDNVAGLAARVAVAPNGDCVVVGEFSGRLQLDTIALDALDVDWYVARFARADGSARWAGRIGGAGADHTVGVAVDANDRTVVAGTISGSSSGLFGARISGGANDLLVAGITRDGVPVWVEQLGGTGDVDGNLLSNVAIAPDGRAAVAASFSGELIVGDTTVTATGSYDPLFAIIPSRW